jgi:hypothetical protein
MAMGARQEGRCVVDGHSSRHAPAGDADAVAHEQLTRAAGDVLELDR